MKNTFDEKYYTLKNQFIMGLVMGILFIVLCYELFMAYRLIKDHVVVLQEVQENDQPATS